MGELKAQKKQAGMLIKERLKSARERLGLTQHELAARAGVAPRIITKRETQTGGVASDTLVALAKTLEVSIDWLCGLTEDMHGYKQRTLSSDESKLLVAYRDWDVPTAVALFTERASAIVSETFGEQALDAIIKKMRNQ